MLTALGLPVTRIDAPAWDKAQDWMCEHGLTPYMPQLRHTLSYNIGLQYNNGRLDWNPATIAEVARFAHPPIFHYNRYYYATHPQTLRWHATPQDSLSVEQLTILLAATLAWLRRQGITDPWLLVDEPPHAEKYGWTQSIETRVEKFTRAAVEANWTIAVAVPGPSQLHFWCERLYPTRWILHDKHGPDEYAPLPTTDIWLYNAATFDGLAERLAAIGATGYLQWSSTQTTNRGPVPILFDNLGDPTPAAHALLSELGHPVQPPTLQEQLDAHERRIQALEARP